MTLLLAPLASAHEPESPPSGNTVAVDRQPLLISVLDVVGAPCGLASLKDGHGVDAQVWLITTSNFLYRLDPWTGKLLLTNQLSLPAGTNLDLVIGSFPFQAYVPSLLNGTCTLAVVPDLYGNTSTNAGALTPTLEGLDFDMSRTLWAISAGSAPSLYTVNPTNGATTLAGPLNITVSGALYGDLAIRGSEKFAVISTASSSRLYSVADNGTATLRGTISGFPAVTGLAFYVRRPGPLTITRVAPNTVNVSWPTANGGYLWRKTNVNAFASPVFQTTYTTTNAFEIFYLSPFPPF